MTASVGMLGCPHAHDSHARSRCSRQAQGRRPRARHLVQASPQQRGAGGPWWAASSPPTVQAVLAAHGPAPGIHPRQGPTARGGARRRGDRPQTRATQVKIVDTNLLLYATDTRAPRHEAAKSWRERRLSGDETIAFAWVVL